MGRGVGLQTAMGAAMAAHLSGDQQALPLPPAEPRHFPLHGLRRAYISAVVAWYRLRDGGLA
jgi:hypothetical protein